MQGLTRDPKAVRRGRAVRPWDTARLSCHGVIQFSQETRGRIVVSILQVKTPSLRETVAHCIAQLGSNRTMLFPHSRTPLLLKVLLTVTEFPHVLGPPVWISGPLTFTRRTGLFSISVAPGDYAIGCLCELPSASSLCQLHHASSSFCSSDLAICC